MGNLKNILPIASALPRQDAGSRPYINYSELAGKVADYVRTYMGEHANRDLLYHNTAHTEQVVETAAEIARHYGLGGRDLFVVLAAAWFHDIGYYDDPANHEQAGAARAEDFLKGQGVEEETVAAVTAAILATRVPQSPSNLLEEIVCDADLYHFGTDSFGERNRLLRKEMEAVYGIDISKEEWADSTSHLLANHHFFTGYCKEHLKKKKRANLEKLEAKVREYTRAVNPIDELLQEQKEGQQAPAGDLYDVTDKPERGVETLFRIASASSQRLSEQADTKAHILISVNSILISVFLTLVVRRVDEYPYLMFPVSIIIAVNLATIVFSILATRPRVPNGVFSTEGIDKEEVNLLFFGNFYKMNYEDYAHSMFRVLKSERLLYSSLVRNLYEQGIVLGQKYRMLKIAYNVFMFGFVISVIVFVIASKVLTPA
ncbi:MAG TPA: Pycsar system effector family protein [Chitinophagaceae bacterium]